MGSSNEQPAPIERAARPSGGAELLGVEFLEAPDGIVGNAGVSHFWLPVNENNGRFLHMIQSAEFEDILPLLVSTYQQGRLVPFLGAGMSAPGLTLWCEFLGKLEQEAGLCPSECKGSPDARAQRACTVIKNRDGCRGFLDAVRNALKATSHEVTMPASTVSLAQIHWPLVISTNYDDLFFCACLCRHERIREASDEIPVEILGRSARDCKLVISSLTGPFDREYIWHVQGFLGGQAYAANLKKEIPHRDALTLENQLVIGHSEYRRVTNRAPDFRRCFTEVFNTRSFLFLGSSLKEERRSFPCPWRITELGQNQVFFRFLIPLCSARIQPRHRIDHFEEPPWRGLDRNIGGFHRAVATLPVRAAV